MTDETPKMRRFMLKARAHLDGQLREPGYVTTKPEDWVGPHRTVVQQHERVHVGEDSTRIPLTGVDEPLYEMLPEEEEKEDLEPEREEVVSPDDDA